MVDPDCPNFTCRYRDWAGPLHLLDELDEGRHGHFGAQRGLVADDDGIDIAVVPGEVERGANFPLVAGLILVDPGADRDFETEFSGDRRDELGAAGGRIGPDGAGIGGYGPQVGADLLSRGPRAAVGMRGISKGWIGNAGELPGDVWGGPNRSQQDPNAGMHARNEREHGSDGPHGLQPRGADHTGPNLPPGSTMVVRVRLTLQRRE